MPRFIPKHVKRRETNNVSLLAMPAVPRLERLEKCSSCKFHDKTPDGRMFECRFNPPVGTLVPGPGGQPMPTSFFPIVNPDWFCGRWKPRIETGKPS